MQVKINEKLKSFILNKYGFEDLEILQVDQNGFRNVFKLVTERGNFIIRIFPENRSKEQVIKDVEILIFLEKENFPAPRLIPTRNGEFMSKFNNSYALLISYIEGQHPDSSEQTLHTMGELLAKLHKINHNNYPHESSLTIHSEIQSLKGALQKKDLTKLDRAELIPQVLNALDSLPSLNFLPKTIIHTDIHPKNMIQNGDDYYFIDWDDAGVGTTILDLGYVLSQVCIGYYAKNISELILRENLMKTFMAGYYKHRSLTKEEKENLVLAMQSCSLIYVIQYWHPVIDYLSWERYKITKNNKEKILKLIG